MDNELEFLFITKVIPIQIFEIINITATYLIEIIDFLYLLIY